MGFSIPTGGRPHRRCRRAAIAAAGAVAADHGDYGDTTGAAEIHGESGERWEIFSPTWCRLVDYVDFTNKHCLASGFI